jgi:hypothetical protein
LSSGGEPVDAGRQHRLDRGRDLDRLDRLGQPIPAPLPGQRFRLHEGPDGLLQEERVPALDEELLEQREPGILSEERLQQLRSVPDRWRHGASLPFRACLDDSPESPPPDHAPASSGRLAARPPSIDRSRL